MTEQDYLEMSNHFKEVYEKMEKKIEKKNKVIKDLYKKIMFNYTFSLLIDEIVLEMDLPFACPLNVYSQTLVSANSDSIDCMMGLSNNEHFRITEINLSPPSSP